MSIPSDIIISNYSERIEALRLRYEKISHTYGNLTWGRLFAALAALACFYISYQQDNIFVLCCGIICAALFVMLMRRHQRVAREKQFTQALLLINKEELAYLGEGKLSFADGNPFKYPHHAYAEDLDLFGPRSLYQHINRTATQMGKESLAEAFTAYRARPDILERQQAVAELAEDKDHRHELYALGRIAHDNEDTYRQLLQWTAETARPLHPFLLVLAFLFPAILLGCVLVYTFSHIALYKDIALRLVPLNLFVFSFQVKRIKRSLFTAEKTHAMLQSYTTMLRSIEKATYQAPMLRSQQQKLFYNGQQASTLLQKLASIYAGMETIQNPFAAVITNGLYLNHIHLLYRLIRWRRQYATLIPQWLEVIGTFEMLGSLANFSDNNPAFSFPGLNGEERICFTALGHPLLPEGKRICNDIRFDVQRFIILTGSNMSGKSTFLRTLGINMVLAGTGSVVCAAAADVHPMPVLVSMRQSDSLADNESYFFAEVKRLKYIMDQSDPGPVFMLLDEILRGTNSDDKRSGTIGVIEKITAKKVYGAIATHDLEVCLITDRYPSILSNKCFEVEIRQDELVFDYKLREGICKNKSATFLMRKMKII